MKAWEAVSANMQGLMNGSTESRKMVRKQRSACNKSNCSFIKYVLIMTLLLSGGISLNPGTLKCACAVYLRPISKSHRTVSCDACSGEVHMLCEGITQKEYRHLIQLDEFPWTSRRCFSIHLLFSNISNDVIEDQFGNVENSNFI